MISSDSLPDDDLAYPVSLRRARRAAREDARPDTSGFEATSRQRLARSARFRRGSAGPVKSGIHLRGSGKLAALACDARL